MSYTFLLDGESAARQIALVRSEIDDISGSTATNGGKEGTDYFMTDERIAAALASAAEEAPVDANTVEIRLFAASSCEATLAKNQTFILKKARTLGREDDGPAVGAEIRKHAESLNARAWKSLNDRRALAAQAGVEASGFRRPRSGNYPLRATR